LARIAARERPSDELAAATSRLLRLVAIALTPGSDAGGQGRLGLLRLGRAALCNRWIADDLAMFVGIRDPQRRLGQRLVFSSLRQVASPLSADPVLPMTLDFVRKWASTVGPRRGSWLPPEEAQPYRELVDALRRRVDQERGAGRNVVVPDVGAMLTKHGLARQIAEDGGDAMLLRRFGLTVVSEDG
jgi:hypothetical protein